MKTKIKLMFVLIGLASISCYAQKDKFDKDAETKKILALEDLNKQVLLKADIKLIRKMDECTPDSTVYVMQGDYMWNKSFRFMSDSEVINAFGLNQMHYTQIKDLKPIIINFSPDGKMAYQIGKLSMVYEVTDSNGNKKSQEFIVAYLEIWEKRDNCWASVAISQTFNYGPVK
jgi:hypothetical protein